MTNDVDEPQHYLNKDKRNKVNEAPIGYHQVRTGVTEFGDLLWDEDEQLYQIVRWNHQIHNHHYVLRLGHE